MSEEEEIIDGALLAGDRSQPGWRRRALSGMTAIEAMSGLPPVSQITFELPSDQAATLRAWCRINNISIKRFCASAVARAVEEVERDRRSGS